MPSGRWRSRKIGTNSLILAVSAKSPYQTEDRDAVLLAVDAFHQGLDLADAPHMARSSRASGFATFDQRLAIRAKGLALLPPVELLV